MESNTSSECLTCRVTIPGSSSFDYYIDFVLGILMGMMTIIGLMGNITVVVLFTKHKCLKSRTTYLIRSLAVSDGIMALIGGTMYTINCFNHRWVFYDEGCLLYAMVMYWCGTTSIAHLVVIAIERAATISNPVWSMAMRGKLPAYIPVMLAFCWLFGLGWSVLPFLGIHRYGVEGRVSCSLDWEYISLHSYLYSIMIFGASFLIPLIVMTCCHGVILYIVHRSTIKTINSKSKRSNQLSRSNQRLEWKIAKSMLIATAIYLSAWTPYALAAMWASFGEASEIPDTLFNMLGFFAKTSFVLNPFLYVGTNKLYRKKYCQMLFRGYWTRYDETSASMSMSTQTETQQRRNPIVFIKNKSKVPQKSDNNNSYTGSAPTGCYEQKNDWPIASQIDSASPDRNDNESLEAKVDSISSAENIENTEDENLQEADQINNEVLAETETVLGCQQ